MKKNIFIKTALLTTLSAASLFALSNLSACTDIVGIDTGYKPWCKINFEIKGPDEIFIDPGCSAEEVMYELFADGEMTEAFPNGTGWDLTWEVTGDFKVVSATDPTPLIVLPPEKITAVSGVGFAQISVTGKIHNEECGREGDATTYATKTVSIFNNVMDISSTVTSFGGSLGAGFLTVEGDKALGDKTYVWEIFPADAAIITPSPGTPICEVKDAKSNFKVRVQKFNKDKTCVTPVEKDIEIIIK
jgi:hypothetical protein